MPDLEFVDLPDGTTRRLGNIVPPAGLVASYSVYGDRDDEPLIPRPKWDEEIAKFGDPLGDYQFLPPVHDQDGVGQCNPESVVTAIECRRLMQGLPYVRLSAADLYDRVNGGRDQGSLLEDALKEALNGVGTAATSGELWKRGFRPAGAAERARFAVLEYALCPTFDHLMSAAMKGRPVISGIMWYGNYTPGPDGMLPRGRGQAGGHAIFGFRPAKVGNVYGIVHQQSWGKWGPRGNGRFIIPEFAYSGPVGGWWALCSVIDEGGIVPAPS